MPRIDEWVRFCNDAIDVVPFGNFLCNLLRRPVFSISPDRREQGNDFVAADFFGKMRSINAKMVAAIFISSLNIRQGNPFIGSFLQGVALAHEVVYLV